MDRYDDVLNHNECTVTSDGRANTLNARGLYSSAREVFGAKCRLWRYKKEFSKRSWRYQVIRQLRWVKRQNGLSLLILKGRSLEVLISS